MLTRHCCRADPAISQGGHHSSGTATARSNPDDVSAKVFARALPTLEEVVDFLELASSPESQPWAERALAYAVSFESPPDRMAGLMLARAWLATTPFVLLRRPVGRLRLHVVTDG